MTRSTFTRVCLSRSRSNPRFAVAALRVVAAMSLASSASEAHAQEATDAVVESPPHFGGQRQFGFGPTLGLWSGMGGVVGAGGDVIKAWASGGYMPVMIFGNKHGSKALTFDYYGSAQLNADLTARFFHRRRVELAVRFGYKYNTVLGHGGGVGVALHYDLARWLGLNVTLGPAVFPSSENRLVNKYDYPTDRDPATPWIHGGLNLDLVFYP
jgi:hypothetical protein